MGRFWIIKSIFKVHIFYYIAAFVAVITGHFKGFLCFSLIIIVHEMGHILMGIKYGWRIEKVLLLPFGALTIFHEDLNRKIKEEFWIVIMGPLFQIVFTIIIYYFFGSSNFIYYSLIILGFNLLPIFPLDGSKILNLFFNRIFSFKSSHLLLIFVSILSILVLLFKVNCSLIFVLIVLFLIIRICLEIKDHDSLFNRFLLERYLNKYHFKKIKRIPSMNMNGMKRDYGHLFFDGNKYISEMSRLKKRFDFRGKV